jgi:alcohol dehydrogenase class IV
MGAHRFVYPPVDAVIHGHEALDSLVPELDRRGARRVLVITSPSVRRSEAFAHVADALGDRCAAVFDDSVPHLPVEMADRLIETAWEAAPDSVVTLGGGTVSDAGKAVVAALTIGARGAGDLSRMRFLVTGSSIEGGLGDGVEPRVPQIAIPTTLSAAEYCGAFAMSSNGVKDGYVDIRLTPRVVILDPRAVFGTPDRLWASTGMRAMDHAVETYLSRTPSPPTDAAAAAAAEALLTHLRASIERPADPEPRLHCLIAGWLSMSGFHNAFLGLSHAIGHQLGARWGVPHGETSCVTLPTVTRLLASKLPARAGSLARRAGLAAPSAGDQAAAASLIDAIEALVAALPVPRQIREVGVPEDALEPLATTVVEHTTARYAPFDLSVAEVMGVLRAAY